MLNLWAGMKQVKKNVQVCMLLCSYVAEWIILDHTGPTAEEPWQLKELFCRLHYLAGMKEVQNYPFGCIRASCHALMRTYLDLFHIGLMMHLRLLQLQSSGIQHIQYTIMILHQLLIYTSIKHSLFQTSNKKRLRFTLQTPCLTLE